MRTGTSLAPYGPALARSLALWLALTVTAAGLASAQTAVSDAELARSAHRIARDVMSPFCPGRTLADCPSPNALAVREQIRELLLEGVPEAQVRERLGAVYGDAIVGVPRSALGWALPALLLLAGLGLLAVVLRRLSAAREPRAAESVQSPRSPDGLAAELDRELHSRGL